VSSEEVTGLEIEVEALGIVEDVESGRTATSRTVCPASLPSPVN
jgi:hypothetical protein